MGRVHQEEKLNDRKLNALIDETTKNMQKVETAILRMSNDKYRKVIYDAQVYANSGAGTYEKAVDMATNDFLNAGINCVQYKNGARVSAAAYASMAIRTANKRAYLQGEGEKRKEWGITTVIMNQRGTACPKCFKFAGKIFIDDVWSGGTSEDGPYPLLSTAIAQGLYHPNCKDSHTTYFPGITEEPKELSKEEKDKSEKEYARQQRLNYYARQEDACRRKAECSLDRDKKKVYEKRVNTWRDKRKSLYKEMENGDIAKSVGSNIVDISVIRSKEYRRKFRKITDNSAVNNSIRKYSNAILTHRNGTDKEDLYIINSKTGKLLFSKTNSNINLGIDLTKEEIELISEHSKKDGIIGLHNHPSNILPTGGDFAASGYRGYDLGVVVTHDCEVITYRHGDKPFRGKMLDKSVDKECARDYNKNIIDAQKKVLNQFGKEYGIRWKMM